MATTSRESVIRVAIMGEPRLFREGLRLICGADPSLMVVGEGSLGEIRGVLRATVLDILVADARVDGALMLCEELRYEGDGARPWVILLADEADDDWAARALQAGARGILPKSTTGAEVVRAIHAVHEEQIWASERVVARVVSKLAVLAGVTQAAQAILKERLSRRQREIVHHATNGLSNQEIADRLNISEATVKAHLTHIFLKLGVRDRAQLAARYRIGSPPS